jgi:hypothetical protein
MVNIIIIHRLIAINMTGLLILILKKIFSFLTYLSDLFKKEIKSFMHNIYKIYIHTIYTIHIIKL